MNNKEKMLSGLMYDSNDETLVSERKKAKDLCFRYNNTNPTDTTERKKIIQELFGKIGENFNIESDFWCDYGYNIEAGENFYINHNCTILDCAKIKFGNNVFIAPNCGFYTAGHPLDYKARNKYLEFAHPINIGNNVWIGANCHILPNVTIGDNVVIGAGSLVTKDIPPNTLAYGSPCRPIKEIEQ